MHSSTQLSVPGSTGAVAAFDEATAAAVAAEAATEERAGAAARSEATRADTAGTGTAETAAIGVEVTSPGWASASASADTATSRCATAADLLPLEDERPSFGPKPAAIGRRSGSTGGCPRTGIERR